MTQGIFLKPIKNKFIDDFIEDVANTETSYYITFGKYDEWPTVYASNGSIISDDNNAPEANSSIAISNFEVYRNMLYGKQFTGVNIAYVVNRINWTANTVYDYYDDQDPNLYSKNFYVVNSSNRVYKCLFNNYGAQSTVEPQNFNPNGDFVTLPDGYKWKYLYTINSLDYNRFASTSYVPVKRDTLVESYATVGAIHVIKIDNAGTNYPYANGSVVSRISPTVIQLSPSGLDNINGIYQDSTFYVYSGSGNNFISTIVDYTVNTTGNFITTSKPTPILNSTTKYKIGPTVTAVGDGTGMEAFAYVEPIANSILTIDVVNQGTGYTYANVTITANSLALGTGGRAAARAIISPPGGHGSNAITELGCDTTAISVEATPQDDLPTWATYRQLGILYNPTAVVNNSIFNETTFKQYTTITKGYRTGIYSKGSLITGLASGAEGTVIYSDSANIYLTAVKGSFQSFETIYEPSTGVTNIINAINTNDLIPFTGDIFYYKNIEPITRYSGSREQIKIYFKI